jgi:hypothetical protein
LVLSRCDRRFRPGCEERAIAELRANLLSFVVSSAAAAGVGTIRFLASMNGRASGPIGEANDFAYVLATAAPLALYLAWRKREHRAIWLVASAVLLVTIALTFSRGAFVSLGLAALWAALHNRTIAKGW